MDEVYKPSVVRGIHMLAIWHLYIKVNSNRRTCVINKVIAITEKKN
jgi:hypothetical protein